MPDQTHELKAALGDAVADARRDLGSHPPPDALLAYNAGKLSTADQREVEDHLVLCRECQGLLLDTGCFADPDFGAEREVSEMEMAAVWRGLRESLVASEGAPARADRGETDPPERHRIRRLSRRALPSLLAASLAVVAVGLSMWIGALRQSLNELSRPQLNTPIYDLYSHSSVRGQGEREPTIEVPPAAESFTIILVPDQAPSVVTVEIFSGNRSLWQGAGLKKNPDDSFTLHLSRRFLTADVYRIELHHPDRERESLIAAFQLSIEDRE